VAEGHDPIWDDADRIVGWKRNIYSYPPIGSPDGGAHVTAADLDRFLRAVHRGALLTPEMTRAFLTPQVQYRVGEHGNLMFGHGLKFGLDQDGQVLYYGKEGINAGVSAYLRHYPAQDINLVLLSNTMDGVWEPMKRVHDLIIESDCLNTSTSCVLSKRQTRENAQR
jgi:hypothetical protein